MGKVVLLLDEKSKQFVKLDNTVLNASDVTIVNSLAEIKEEYLDDLRYVFILEGFIRTENNISDLRIYKSLAKYNYMIICADNAIVDVLGDLGRVFQRDLQVIDFELLQSCIYSDKSQEDNTQIINDSIEYAKSVKNSESPNSVKLLADNYLTALERIDVLQECLSEKEKIVREMQSRNAILVSDNKKWFDGCSLLVSRARKLNIALQKYEEIYTQDIYNKINLNSYPNRPTIVYLKVFTEFAGLELLLQTLFDSFRIQQDKSVKVLRLYDSSSSRQIRFLPEYYTVLRNHYDIHRVIQSDYICKSGDYTNLMDKLLNNKYGLSVLIIVDIKDFDDVILKGSFMQYNLCATQKQAELLGLPKDYSLLNEATDGWLNWDEINLAGYSREEAFLKLSSKKIIQRVLTLSDKYRNTF